jgi:hypothetical protein
MVPRVRSFIVTPASPIQPQDLGGRPKSERRNLPTMAATPKKYFFRA